MGPRLTSTNIAPHIDDLFCFNPTPANDQTTNIRHVIHISSGSANYFTNKLLSLLLGQQLTPTRRILLLLLN